MRIALSALALLLTVGAATTQADEFSFGKSKTGKASSFADVATLGISVDPKQAKPGQTVKVTLTVTPKPGAWTYPVNTSQGSRNTIALRGDLVLEGQIDDPLGQTEKPSAEGTGVDRIYKIPAKWVFNAQVSPSAAPGKRAIPLTGTRLQACNDVGCFLLSPAPSVELEVLPGAVTASPVSITPPPQAPVPPPVAAPMPNTGLVKKAPLPLAEYAAALDALKSKLTTDTATNPTANLGSGGLKTLLLAAAFWGLVSLVTPCVFPMIPITVSLFLKQSHQSPAQVLKLAAVYCATIIGVLGVSAVFLLSIFRKLSVDPAMNIFLGGLFVFFALSLFGMYDITLPGFMLRFTERRRGAGGMIGTVFGALAFSIVSFTCVAPFLGGFAGMAAAGNFSQVELILAGLTFATAFASPFFVLALFPSLLKKLPRSGGWLDTVKVVMGFLELAAAFKFFRTAEIRLLDRPEYFTYDVVLAGWVAIAAAAGLYLLNLYRLPHDEEQPHIGVPRLMIGLAFLGLAVYLTPALFKTGGHSPRPAGVVYAWVNAFLLPDTGEDLPWSADLPGAIARIRNEKATGTAAKPLVFVDFTGVTCTNCRYNEHNIFTRPEVRELLQKYTLVEMYTDEVPGAFYTVPPTDADRSEEATANLVFQRSVFGTEQLPLYAILEPQVSGGVRVVGVYDEGKINNVPGFVEFLKKPLAK